MFYVYILRSISYKNQIYVGYTSYLAKRLEVHNSGQCKYTSSFKPWEVSMYLAFKEEEQALKFEKYLKTGSGNSFLKRRFL